MTESSKAVFLSYASEDAGAAARICEALRAAGIEVWFDQSELRGGDAWDQKIRQQVRDCSLFIPIISANTVSRPEGYFRLEWAIADHRTEMIARNKALIVPVCIDKTPDRGADVPESFLRVQWTRLPGGETPGTFSERVGALLGGGEPKAVSQQNNTHVPDAGALAKTPRHWMNPVCGAVLAALIAGVWVYRMAHPGTAAAPAVASPVVTAPEKSIAVLPFVDMSEKHDQEYFSDGLSEELIDHLAHSPELKVIARTSSFAFKGKNEDMRTIASKLGVANLLEGSVRKAGNELRITAQLIRASDGVHLWSETYERTLNDVFKVQDEISATVAKALDIALSHAESSRRESNSPEAYSLLLQANYYSVRYTKKDFEKAIGYAQAALKLDPAFVKAWARLSITYEAKVASGFIPMKEGRQLARQAALRAIELGPALPYGHSSMVYILIDEGDFAGAESELRLAEAAEPSGHVFLGRANLELTLGRWRNAANLYERGLQSDPLNSLFQSGLASAFWLGGRLGDAKTAFRRTIDLAPQMDGVHGQLALVLLENHELQLALAEAQREDYEPQRLAALALISGALGRHVESQVLVDTLESKFGESFPEAIAGVYAIRGNSNRAFEWLDRAVDARDPSVFAIKADPLLKSLHGDPRYKVLLRKINLPDA